MTVSDPILPSFDPRSRAGSDSVSKLSMTYCSSFDPRSRAGSDGWSKLLAGLGKTFRSTLPSGERLGRPEELCRPAAVSIHAPERGATRMARHSPSSTKFRSTLPSGERRKASCSRPRSRSFDPRSRAGSDLGSQQIRERWACFDPRSRAGSDDRMSPAMLYSTLFRSTLPSGERHPRPRPADAAGTVSIHAPERGATVEAVDTQTETQGFDPRSRAGSDNLKPPAPKTTSVFRSTLPSGERRGMPATSAPAEIVSIHAPERGATGRQIKHGPPQVVSIHAPERGATMLREMYRIFAQFRSTLPSGERRSSCSAEESLMVKFRSTLPSGERLDTPAAIRFASYVSIHAPERGATIFSVRLGSSFLMFRSTLPSGERRLRPCAQHPRGKVSIHAPERGATAG